MSLISNPAMNTLLTRSFMNTSAWIASRGLLHTGSKQPAMPATKPVEQEQELPPVRPSFPQADHPKHRPRRKPGITDFDEFMAIQEAWSSKLPLDEDPTIPEDVVKRPVRTHTQAVMRGLFSNEALIALQRKYDYSFGGMRRWYEKWKMYYSLTNQRFIPMRHGILGPDLASGHFVTYRGGRVKFVGHSEWFTVEEDLPTQFDENYLVQKVDATSIDLRWEGVDNISNLYYLEDLNLTNNPGLDVWAFDKLYRQYRFSTKLQKLNVSRCCRFCERSLACAHRIQSLQEIIITDTAASQYKFLDLVVLQLQDINPKLRVVI